MGAIFEQLARHHRWLIEATHLRFLLLLLFLILFFCLLLITVFSILGRVSDCDVVRLGQTDLLIGELDGCGANDLLELRVAQRLVFISCFYFLIVWRIDRLNFDLHNRLLFSSWRGNGLNRRRLNFSSSEACIAETSASILLRSLLDLLLVILLFRIADFHLIECHIQALLDYSTSLLINHIHLDFEMGVDRLMVRHCQLGSIVLDQSHTGDALGEKNTVGPRSGSMLNCVVVVSPHIVLISRGK